jgi:predicted dehydrogenase
MSDDNTASTHDTAATQPGCQQARRSFIQYLGGGAVVAAGALGAGRQAAAQAAGPAQGPAPAPVKITFTPISAPSEAPEKDKPMPEPLPQRVGYAIVGLGRIALNQVLPAMGSCKHSKPVALVSGDRAKALKVARQYDIPESAIYDYQSFDRIADNPAIQAVYIALPNNMHAEFTVRAARAGKHVLCEKPMAVSSAECRQMIDACKKAGRKLMIAYRSQYEPKDRAIVEMVRQKKLGQLKSFVASNAQNMADPEHWRLKRALAGGGPLPDVGIYCLNAARFLSGEEPNEVIGQVYRNPGDARFREVEESVSFILRFPSGLSASCSSGYASHRSQFLRLEGSEAWVELSPAFAYNGIELRSNRRMEDSNVLIEHGIEDANQFALEFDHMSLCVRNDVQPHTPGEEGLQDQRIIEAIYESARTGRPVKLAPAGPTRGPDPKKEE